MGACISVDKDKNSITNKNFKKNEKIENKVEKENKNIAMIIYIRNWVNILAKEYNYSINMYRIPVSKLKLFNSDELNTHQGLGPIHFYYLNEPDFEEETKNLYNEERIKMEEKINKFQKESRNMIFKLKELVIHKEIKCFFKDDVDDIYSKDNNLTDFVIKKIIYIHELK